MIRFALGVAWSTGFLLVVMGGEFQGDGLLLMASASGGILRLVITQKNKKEKEGTDGD